MKRREFLAVTTGLAGSMIPILARAQANPCPPPVLSTDGGASAATQCVSSGSAPAWFTSLGHKQWAAPASNWLGASGVIDPLAGTQPNVGTTGHSAIIRAWTGMGADQTRRMIWMAGNGGHGDYAGNEVYSCDLSSAAPAWIRRRNATLAQPSDGGATTWTIWPDGTPPADHTGNYQVEGDGRWFKVGLGSANWSGFAGNRWWEFNPVSNTWIDRGTGFQSDYYAITGMGLYDPVARHIIKVYANRPNAVAFVNVDTMALAATAGASINSSSNAFGGIDTARRRLAWSYSDMSSTLFVLDLNNKSAGWTSVPISGSKPSLTTFQVYWHAPSGAFITWDGATGIKKLTPAIGADGNYTGAVWSGVAGSGGPAPIGDHDLLYNKIQLINNMGNGDAALIVVPRYGNPDVFVMRLSGAV